MKDAEWEQVREAFAANPAWQTALPWLEPALAEGMGTHTIDDILRGIAEQRFQFWLGKNCAAVTEIIRHPGAKVLNTFLAGGSIREMQRLRAGVEAWGRASGCGWSMFSGRNSEAAKKRCPWAISSGYDPRWTLCVKRL